MIIKFEAQATVAIQNLDASMPPIMEPEARPRLGKDMLPS